MYDRKNCMKTNVLEIEFSVAILRIYQLSSFVEFAICNPLLQWLQSISPLPPLVLWACLIFQIGKNIGWLEVEVGPPIVTPGGGRTTSLRRQAAGNNHDLNHNIMTMGCFQGLQRLLRPLLWWTRMRHMSCFSICLEVLVTHSCLFSQHFSPRHFTD